MLKNRILTTVLLLPILIAAVWFDTPLPWLTIAVAVWGGLAALEFYKIVIDSGSGYGAVPFTVFGIVMTVAFIFSPHLDFAYIIPILLTIAIIFPPVGMILRRNKENSFLSWAWTLTGILYIGWLLSHYIALRELEMGREWVYYALLVTFATDTFAYFIGKTWGKHKLAPAISPKKTIEGALGGLLGAVIISVLTVWLFSLPVNYGIAVFVGIAVSIFGQLGDLFESLFKRNMGVKDSGNSLPGHGGFLDRVDSIVFTGVVVYYYVVLFVG
ncbi:MAG TPA: phosphatidate cytidylyltransferase [Dehalococcoidia bacterium]|nr:phosphatidate cytidylyltransferase [Dehalococcoidia bacterium]